MSGSELGNRFRIARGEKPQFHDDPAIDDVISMIVGLAGEVSVLRERLDAHERLAGEVAGITPDQVDHYEPDAAAEVARSELRKRIVEKVFRSVLAQESNPAAATHASVVADIEDDPNISGTAGI